MRSAALRILVFDLDAPLPPGAADWLGAGERERAGRFATPVLQRRFVAGRARLRQFLAARTGARPERLRLAEDENGKPRLVDDDTAFNLSHSGNLALLAFGAAGRELGVDIERLAELGDIGLLLDSCLSSQERGDAILDDPIHARSAFLRLWVRKEACLKAIGQGLRIEPCSFTVGLGPHPAAPVLELDGQVLHLQDLDTGLPGCAAAIAVTGPMPPPAIPLVERYDDTRSG